MLRSSSSALVTFLSRRYGSCAAAVAVPAATAYFRGVVPAPPRSSSVAAAATTASSSSSYYYFSTGTAGSRSDEVEGGLNAEQLQVLDEMFGKMDKMQAELQTLRAQVQEMAPPPFYGVDAPDGESDAELADDICVAQDYIENAATHEDAAKINQQHKLQEDVKKFHARDPEHDW